VTNVTGHDHKEGRANRHTQILTAVITAVATLGAAGIGLLATDSRVVTGPPTPGPTVTQTVTVAPTATGTETMDPNEGGLNGGGDGGAPSPTKTALDVNWETTASDYESDIGITVQFDCPPRGIPQDIWGDGVYTGDSSVCTAGVHDGRITLKKGGRLIVEIREGAPSYPATRRNGITSQEFDEYRYSFEFLPAR
jgi:hypothetical protein